MADDEDRSARSTDRRLRVDLVIAVCALLISSLASGASWWQARLLSDQTAVLRAQLSAQVWPYIELTEELDTDTVAIKLVNNGLGPAVLRSITVSVDGKRSASLTAVLHAILGPELATRRSRGAALGRLSEGQETPGAALRPGDSTNLLVFRSTTLARRFVAASDRVAFRMCYCAIVPDQCWLAEGSAQTSSRTSVASCPEIRDDLMHAPIDDALRPTL
jgi:hypothetical protein